MAGSISSLYPQPPQPQDQDFIRRTGTIIDLMNRVNEYRSNNQLRDILKKNADPNNPAGFDAAGVSRDVINQQLWHAPQLISQVQGARTATIGAESNDTALGDQRMQLVQRNVASIAAKPNPNMLDVAHVAAWMTRIPGMQKQVDTMYETLGANPRPSDIKKYLTTLSMGLVGPSQLVPSGGFGIDPETGSERFMPPGTAAAVEAGRGARPRPTEPAPPPPIQGAPPGLSQDTDARYNGVIDAGRHAERIMPWRESLRILDEHPEMVTGPGVERRNAWLNAVRALPIPGISGVVDRFAGDYPKTVNELTKWLTQGQAEIGGGFGHGTTEQLLQAASGNPNVSLNDFAVKDMVRMRMAVIRMNDAMRLEAHYSTLDKPGKYRERLAELGTQLDPRAFLVDHMSQKEMDTMMKNTTPQERYRLKMSYELAKKYRMLD